MTIQGAIDELMNLLDADDVPIYYKPSIEKVIDTIILERARRKAIVSYIDESNNRKTEPTCSKMEQVEDEPQTNADQHVQRVEYVGNDERSRCWKCKHFERMHETPISSDGKYYTYVVCTAKECNYEPKDELQIEYIETEDEKLREQCRAFMGIVEQTERSN